MAKSPVGAPKMTPAGLPRSSRMKLPIRTIRAQGQQMTLRARNAVPSRAQRANGERMITDMAAVVKTGRPKIARPRDSPD